MNLSPLPVQRFYSNIGLPLVGGKLFTYAAGTSTKISTYSDSSGTLNTNPVRMNFRGECNVWLDPTLTYKFVLAPSTDTDPPTNPIWSVDNIAGALTVVDITQQFLGRIIYPRTAAEISAGKTPTNYFYPESVVNRYGTNTTPGTTDMTQAIQDALAVHIAGGLPVQFLAEVYLVTDTPLSITTYGVTIRGFTGHSTILNKAGANKATIEITGGQFFDIQGLVLIGAATFPNYGIDLTAFWGNGWIRQIVCQTNGWGIHLATGNTIKIEDYDYWPSGGSIYGGTSDATGRKGGILADGTAAVNSVYLKNINISNYETVANGGAGIRADSSSFAGGFQDWQIDGLNAELGPVATHRSIWASKAISWQIINAFTENGQVLFDKGSRYCRCQIQAGGSGTVALDGTTTANVGMIFEGSSGDTFTADAANDGTIQIGNVWAGGNNDSSVNRVSISTAGTGGVVPADRIGAVGVIERNRSVAMGAWTTPTFSAGDYTSNVGTWTVGSGDVVTMEWSIVGKALTVNFWLDTTTVATTPAQLQILIPGGFTAAKNTRSQFLYTEDNETTMGRGVMRVSAAGTQILLRKDYAGTAWANTTNLTGVQGSFTFEVQ